MKTDFTLDPRYTDPDPDFSNLSITRGNLLFQRWWLKNQDFPFKFYPNESSKMGGVEARRERKTYFFEKKKKKRKENFTGTHKSPKRILDSKEIDVT